MKFNLGVVLAVVGIIGAVNLPVALTNGAYPHVQVRYDEDRNVVQVEGSLTRRVVCYSTWFYKKVFTWYALFFECLIPLTLMIVYNALLIARTRQSSIKLKAQRLADSRKKQEQSEERQKKTILKSISMNSHMFKKRTISTGNLQYMGSRRAKNDSCSENGKLRVVSWKYRLCDET